jgi:hypothetical protein
MPVARWRKSYSQLHAEAQDATLVIVGPFQYGLKLPDDETVALQAWISSGGQALIISRTPIEQFPDRQIHSYGPAKFPDLQAPPEQFVDEKSDGLIAQPTDLTRNVRGLALSGFASRMKFHPPDGAADGTADGTAGSAREEPTSGQGRSGQPGGAKGKAEEYSPATLDAPVIHLGDEDGAALADFEYGDGRVIFLSDPFAVANNGIARGANLTLALNIMRSMGAPNRRILFDEFHHGYHSESNPLVNYFRGTPVPWLLLQGLGLSLLIIYTYGRRFARPLPLPQSDRHSPLEFVGSMANLQQVAQARELALENIYPRFKANLCRRLGLSSRATKDEIIAIARRRRLPISEIELRQTLSDAELTLAGELIDDARLLALVARMRRIISQTAPRA